MYSLGVYLNFLTYPFSRTSTTILSGWYYSVGNPHRGVDYDLSYEYVLAAADGIIETVLDNQPNTYPDNYNWGNYVMINHGNGFKTIYGHLKTGEIIVQEGETVLRGQVIATSGNTGYSTGPHLHFEVWGPSTGGQLANGAYKYDPYGIYSVDGNLEPYLYNQMDDAQKLWTTNPPSHGYFNQYSFDFNSNLSQGMTPNSDMIEIPLPGIDEWQVQVSNANDPAVNSPIYSSGLIAKNIVIDFSAKVLNGGNPLVEGKLYIKDENDSWANFVSIELVNDIYDYNNGEFAVNDYNIYRATLSHVANNDAEMRQFSIQLSNGFSTTETWTFDWIDIKVNAWDFKDNPIAWEIRQDGLTTDFFAENFWRISPTNKQPQIVSPDNLIIDGSYENIKISYSIQNTQSESLRVYFDTGSGFSTECFNSLVVDHDGSIQEISLNLPLCAIGNTQKVMFDLLDNNDYEDKLIAIDSIAFYAPPPSPPSYKVEAFGAGGIAGWNQTLMIAFDSEDSFIDYYRVDVFSSSAGALGGGDGDILSDIHVPKGSNFCQTIDTSTYPILFFSVSSVDYNGQQGNAYVGYKLIGNVVGTDNEGIPFASSSVFLDDYNVLRAYYFQPFTHRSSNYCGESNLYNILPFTYQERMDYNLDGLVDGAEYNFFRAVYGRTGAGY